MNVTKKANTLIINLRLQRPRLSKTKKTMVIATSQGCKKSGQMYRGKDIYVVANAIVFNQPKKKKHSG